MAVFFLQHPSPSKITFFFRAKKKQMIVFFYSKSKADTTLGDGFSEKWKQQLSNFTVYDKDSKYPSVEHKFQAMKFCFSDKPEHGNTIDWASLTPEEAHSHGTKGYFKKHGVSLDVGRWEANKDCIMAELLEHRWDHDELFRRILLRVTTLGWQLVHYSLRDKYWGALQPKGTSEIKGMNRLGTLLMALVEKKMAAGGL